MVTELNSKQNYDRIASCSARNILISEGYQVEKVAGNDAVFNLIAWKEESDILFIRIRRSRKPGIFQFEKDIHILSNLVKHQKIPGAVEIWVLSSGHWKRYHILKGGAVPRV